MKNYRIGSDRTIAWSITRNGEPYNLAGKDITLKVSSTNHSFLVKNFEIDGNKIIWTFLGKDQKHLGPYTLTIIENAGKAGMLSFDRCNAFGLVACSCQENGAGYEDLDISEIELADNIVAFIIETELESIDLRIDDLQENKADVSGYYPQLSVGQADNLPDRGDETEGEIGFRESAGAENSIEDGTANVVELLGNSVVWNQKIDTSNLEGTTQNGVTFTKNADGSISVSTTEEGASAETTFSLSESYIDAANGHKVVFMGCPKGGSPVSYRILDHISGQSDYGEGTVYAIPYGDKCVPVISISKGTVITNLITFFPRFTDLTQMLGAEKAAKINTIEDFNAIKNQLVGVDFNAYNAGEVLGVNIKGFKSVNDNAWDEKWESGTISTNTGSLVANSNATRSANPIKVLPNQSYSVIAPSDLHVLFYGRNNNYLGWHNQANIDGFTTPVNASYIRFYCPSTNTYNHDICIRLAHSGYKTDYVAHEEAESSFDLTPYFPNGMHGIGDVRDSVTPKKATQRIGVVDMGTLNWSKGNSGAGGAFSAPLDNAPNTLTIKVITLGKYEPHAYAYAYRNSDPTRDAICINTNHVFVTDTQISDAVTFKAAMSGVMLYYELATPIEPEIDPQLNMNYKVWDFGTEELLSDGKSAPVHTKIIYGFNATDTIRGNKAKIAEHDVLLKDAVMKDDYAPQLSVGLADNLAGKDTPVDSDITIRQSGGGAIADGTARVDGIKGNSVVWNQLSTTAELNQSYTVESLPIGASVIQGHKYAMIFDSVDARLYLYTKIDGANKIIADSQDGKSRIFTSNYSATSEGSTNTGLWWYILNLNSATTYSAKNIRLIDLTKRFGAGYEPTTIDEFYKRILNLSSEYNAGEVVNTKVASIKSIGRNVWDEQWRNGEYDREGKFFESTDYVANVNLIKVCPNTKYCATIGPVEYGVSAYVYFYDANKRYISWVYTEAGIPFTTPRNAAYMNFHAPGEYGSIYLNDICINLSDPTFNGQYEPYISREQSLAVINDAFPQGMHGIGAAQDEIRYNKATQKWEKVQRIGSVKMKDLRWEMSAESPFISSFWATVSNKAIGQNVLSNKYATDKSWVGGWPNSTKLDKTINGIRRDSPSAQTYANKVWLRDTAFTSASELIASFTDEDILYYELAKPIVIELDFEGNLDYEVWNGGNEIAQTEEFSTPVTTSAIYGFNAYAKIKENEERINEYDNKITELEARKPDWLAADDIRNRTHFIDADLSDESLENQNYNSYFDALAENVEVLEYNEDGTIRKFRCIDNYGFFETDFCFLLRGHSGVFYDILDAVYNNNRLYLDYYINNETVGNLYLTYEHDYANEGEDEYYYVTFRSVNAVIKTVDDAKELIHAITSNFYIIDTFDIHKLHEKYIPSSIARQSEIERLEQPVKSVNNLGITKSDAIIRCTLDELLQWVIDAEVSANQTKYAQMFKDANTALNVHLLIESADWVDKLTCAYIQYSKTREYPEQMVFGMASSTGNIDYEWVVQFMQDPDVDGLYSVFQNER